MLMNLDLVFAYEMLCAIWYYLYYLKKHEKHPWKCVIFSKVAGWNLQLY